MLVAAGVIWSCADAMLVPAAAGVDIVTSALLRAEPASPAVAIGASVADTADGVANGADTAERNLGPDLTASAVGAGAAAAALAGARAGEAGAGAGAALGPVAGPGPSTTQAADAGRGAFAGASSCLLTDSGKGTGAKGWLELLAVSAAEDGLCSGHVYILFDVNKGVVVRGGGMGDGEGPRALLEGVDREGEGE